MIDLTEKANSIVFDVRVVPRASRSEIVGEYDSSLKIRLAAPPVDGAANKELVKLVARTFGIPRSAVEIAGGETSRTKQLRIYGIDSKEFARVIAGLT